MTLINTLIIGIITLVAGMHPLHLSVCNIDIKILKEKKASRKEPEHMQIEREGEILLQNVQGDYLVCLDRGGRLLDSIALAEQVERWKMQSQKNLTFVIGGNLGLSAELLTRADFVLSLSPMTFTHDMTRLILLEQLYRACTIMAGEKYHK